MRLRIASDLHDDVGSNLGSIALLSQSAHREADASSAPAFREIHRLAQDTAESMRDIVWFINPDEDQLDKLALRMKEAAAMLLSGTKWEFSTPDELPIHSLSPEFKRHVFMIFKECLNNIRKHAQAANVVIQLKAPSTLELTIRDDGIGFDPALRACGHGLDNMERRADENGWQLRIVSRPGAGTTVHLSAPLD